MWPLLSIPMRYVTSRASLWRGMRYGTLKSIRFQRTIPSHVRSFKYQLKNTGGWWDVTPMHTWTVQKRMKT